MPDRSNATKEYTMKTETASVVYLKDYQPPVFRITETRLEVDLDFYSTRVQATHQVSRTPGSSGALELHLDTLDTRSVSIDGSPLSPEQYQLESDRLVVQDVPDEFELGVECLLHPHENTALSGLYKSGDMLCTQCEAEGFRRIVPSVDRPDNLARYTVTLRAHKGTFPVLLCNGNLVDQGDLDHDRHFATWNDPFPKPTYLFAIVAGDLSCMEDHFTTMSGRHITLRFYARQDDIGKCSHAMDALKRSMAWDEREYGREYDLELYNVVAVSDFNMGAMENKSLNIFNTKYVLADSNMGTDTDFFNVEGVIGHEYFHNWSGNRVTCRDWFQLSLKEGFTVFRDQEFSADMGSRAVKRVDDVNVLRSHQFREDAGPMAHPVRPDSYIEINNFYTATVYNKGAEVVRMIQTLLGPEVFRKGTDLYFDLFDGQAVTTDDFVFAMEQVSGNDLTQFKRWYSQAGTPVVDVVTHYIPEQEKFTIKLSQWCPPTPKQDSKDPFVIPIKTALYSQNGDQLIFDDGSREKLLVLESTEQVFDFGGIKSKPVASLLRGFSAPVELKHSASETERALLLSHDDDPFNRWESGQKLFLKQIIESIHENKPGIDIGVSDTTFDAFGKTLADTSTDPAFIAKLLTLPSESYISELVEPIDPDAIYRIRHGIKTVLASAFRPLLLDRYTSLQDQNTGEISAEQSAIRSLRNTCLEYLIALDESDIHQLAEGLLEHSRCMTDSVSALGAIANSSFKRKSELLEKFYQEWRSESLVVDKWLRIQATVPHVTTLRTIQTLTNHEAFDYKNPNKVFALLLGFSHGNAVGFHAVDGSGYEFVKNWVVKLDPINPQISARLVSAFNHWKKYTGSLKQRMKDCLQEIGEQPGVSRDVAEIVENSLKY